MKVGRQCNDGFGCVTPFRLNKTRIVLHNTTCSWSTNNLFRRREFVIYEVNSVLLILCSFIYNHTWEDIGNILNYSFETRTLRYYRHTNRILLEDRPERGRVVFWHSRLSLDHDPSDCRFTSKTSSLSRPSQGRSISRHCDVFHVECLSEICSWWYIDGIVSDFCSERSCFD